MTRIAQPSFAAGEVSPEVWARVDIAKYQVGLEVALNFLVKPQGGLINRPGCEFIAPCKFADQEAVLIPFSFNTEQTYMLVFSEQCMWVIRDGGMVLNSSQNIGGITQADPGVLTVTSHGYSDGTWIFVSGITGMTELNNRFFKIANSTTHTFTLQDQNGNDIDTSGFTAYSSGGTVASIYEISTPYADTDLSELNYTQSADIMTLVHQGYQQRDLSRTGHTSWTLSTKTFAASIAAPTGVGATNSTGSGSTTYDYVVTAEDDDTGEISVASSNATCTNDLGTAGNENTISWSAVSGAERYNVYKKKNGIYGWIGQTPDLSFIDDNIGPDVTDTPPENRNPYGSSDNYPGAVMYHEQREIFGGTINNQNAVEATQIGRYNNMNRSRPTKADDSWSFGIVAEDVQEVRAFVSLTDLLAFTSNGVWKMAPGSSSDTITPSSISVRQQSVDGIKKGIKPLVVGNTVLYVHDMGHTIGDIGYNFQNDAYIGDDLTILAKHLFKTYPLVDWTWHKEPYRCAWGIREDGIACAMTYQRNHQVWAWTRHETDGLFKRAATIREGDENFTYFIIDRVIGGQTFKYIERMKTRRFTNVDEAFFVDSGLTIDNWNANAASTVTLTGGVDWDVDETLTLTENATLSPFVAGDVGREIVLRVVDSNGVITDRCRFKITGHTSSTVVSVQPLQAVPENMQGVALTGYGFAQSTISNLWHLEGKTVIALADGDVEGDEDDLVVTDGEITLQTAAVQIHVGLGYNCDFKTLRLTGSPQNAPVVGQIKSIPYVDVFLEETRGLEFGPNFDNLRPLFERDDEDWGEPGDLITGLERVYMKSDWNDGQFVIRQSYPLPAGINGIMPEVEVGG